MRVLILGGTRFIGAAVAEELLLRGHDVTLLSRGEHSRRRPAGVAVFWGRREDPAVVRRALKDGPYDWVIDNIAFEGDVVRQFAEMAAGSFERYLLTSTAWVYLAANGAAEACFSESDLRPSIAELPRRHRRLTEAPVPSLTHRYVAGKLQAEAAALELPKPSLVVRPGMVAGEGDHNQRIAFYARRAADGGPVLLTDGGTRGFQLLWVRDLARATADLCERPPTDTRVLNVAPAERLSARDILEMAASGLGRAPCGVSIPRGVLREHYPEYMQSEPFADVVPGCYDSSALGAVLPGFAFTPAQEWVKDAARAAVADPAAGDPLSRDRELEIAAEFIQPAER